jgi:hypothetical protein
MPVVCGTKDCRPTNISERLRGDRLNQVILFTAPVVQYGAAEKSVSLEPGPACARDDDTARRAVVRRLPAHR